MNVSGSGGCIIDNSKQYVLIGLEGALDPKLRKWGFPKGRKEIIRDKITKEIRFETEEECYLREIKEETGIDLANIPNIVVRKRRINSRRFYKIYLKMPKDEISIRIPSNDEIVDLKWIKIDDLKEKVEENPDAFNSGVRKLCQYNFLQEELIGN